MTVEHNVVVVNAKGGFFGGTERYVHDSSALLRRHGWRLWGLFEEPAGTGQDEFRAPFEDCLAAGALDATVASLKQAGVRTAFIHKTLNRKLLEALRREFKCVHFVHDHDLYCLRRHKYFIVGRINCHLPFNLLYCSACSCLLSKAPPHFINPFERAALLDACRQADCCVVLSEYMRGNLLMNGVAPGRIVKLLPVAPVPPPVKAGPPPPGGPARLLYVGQLIRGKGVDLLLKALRHVRGDYRLTVLGKGNDRGRLERLAASEGLGGKVEFKGFCDDLDSEYDACDLVAVPSRWQEPFGLVGVEAFAHAKPVVGFDVGGIGEWLKDGQTGLLVPEGDLRAFAAALSRLMGDAELRRALGENGLRFALEQCREADFVANMDNLLRGLDNV